VGLATLAPGASGRVQFGFRPTRPGGQALVVAVGFDGVAAPLLVSASALGIDGRIGAVPPTLTIGPLVDGCGSGSAQSALVNQGAATLIVTGVDLAPLGGPFVVDAGTLPFTLLPGASRAVEVRASGPPIGRVEAIATFLTDLGVTAELRASVLTVDRAEPVEERFIAAPVSAVDILFVVDDSGSMADDQEELANNFRTFFEVGLGASAPDFQVGVTTTDVLSPGAARGAFVGPVPIMTRATPNLEAAFSTAVRVGTNGSGLELGLEAMRLALESAQNASFVRPQAALSIIFVTDEEDTGAAPELLPDPALARAPDDYAAQLDGLKAGAVGNAPVLVSGVLPRGAPRYEALVRRFGGAVLDITSPDWGAQLSVIGLDTFALSRSYTLAAEPDESSLEVTVAGAPALFRFDRARNTVVLDVTPPAGAEVVVRYRSSC
jgi:hypothetical protein